MRGLRTALSGREQAQERPVPWMCAARGERTHPTVQGKTARARSHSGLRMPAIGDGPPLLLPQLLPQHPRTITDDSGRNMHDNGVMAGEMDKGGLRRTDRGELENSRTMSTVGSNPTLSAEKKLITERKTERRACEARRSSSAW